MITCNFSLSGLSKLKVGYQSSTYSPLNYPIYPVFESGSKDILSLQEDTDNKIFTLNPTTGVLYEDLPSTFGSFTEELIIDQNGRYYKRTFNFSTILDDNLLPLLDQKYVMFFATDSNGLNWLFGYDHPMKLDSYVRNSGLVGDGGDRYDLIYTSISYITIKQYHLPPVIPPAHTAILSASDPDCGNPTDPTCSVLYTITLSAPTVMDTPFRIEHSNQDGSYYNVVQSFIPDGYTTYSWTAIYNKKGTVWYPFAHFYQLPTGYGGTLWLDVTVEISTLYS